MEDQSIFFNTSDFTIQSTNINKGPHGDVFIVENNSNKKEYFAKTIDLKYEFDGHEQVIFLRESVKMHELHHPAIADYIGINLRSFASSKILAPTTITDYYENGSLMNMNFITNQNWTATKKYISLLGICDALDYLYEQGIKNLNLKPENILLDADYYPHVSDYYYSKCFPKMLIDVTNDQREENLSSIIYSAPELLQKNAYDQSVHVYSFGMIAYYIITSTSPFADIDSPRTLREKVIKGDRPKFPEFVSQKMQSLISNCWNEIPDERPTFKEIFDILSSDMTYFTEPINETEVTNYLISIKDSKEQQNKTLYESPIEKQIKDLKATMLMSFANQTKYVDEEKDYLMQAAELDNEKAFIKLGDWFYRHNNYSEAKKYYEKAAKKCNNKDALKCLGDIYYYGKGVEKNYNKAIEIYEKAAENGSYDALKFLGDIYYYGQGVDEDQSKASSYYQQAALVKKQDKNDISLNNDGWLSFSAIILLIIFLSLLFDPI